jgi:Zn-dependent protease
MFGLELSFMPSAVFGLALVWAIQSANAAVLLRVPPAAAVAGGLALGLLHFVSELTHQLGHATAARRGGHPMIGVRFWGPFGMSIYPSDEPELPARDHLRRALGGPIGSSVVTIAIGVLALVLWALAPSIAWIGLLWLVDNLLVFTLGAFLPLGFTDGSTILHWARRA